MTGTVMPDPGPEPDQNPDPDPTCWPPSPSPTISPTLGSAMRILGYTAARILVLGVSLLVLYLLGARGILLIALAFVISAILSYILLYGQRERLAGALNRRIEKATSKAAN